MPYHTVRFIIDKPFREAQARYILMSQLLPRLAPLALLCLAPLAGCVPDLGKQPVPRSAATLASATSLPDQAGAWPGQGWWQTYGDPQLDQLIAEGLAGSPDVAAAGARLDRALAEAREAGAALRPSAGLSSTLGAAKFPSDIIPGGVKSFGNVYGELKVDLDLFGRLHSLRRASIDASQAAAIDAAEARLTLSAGIASAYAELARLYAARDVAEQTVRVQTDSARLVADRVASGLDTEGERSQARARVPAAQVDIAALDEQILEVRHQLAALVGAGPDRGLAIARPRLAGFVPQALPSGAGIGLVGRRPDIAAARARAEAASERIHAAKAQFYPDVSISALAGLNALGLQHLISDRSAFGLGGPAISLPIFDNGTIGARYRQSRADYDLAVADYDRVLIEALRQVSDALAARDSLGAQREKSAASLAQSENAYRIAKLRYEGGLSTYLSVLTTENALIEARRRDVDLGARAVTLDIALVRALGGGFAASGD